MGADWQSQVNMQVKKLYLLTSSVFVRRRAVIKRATKTGSPSASWRNWSKPSPCRSIMVRGAKPHAHRRGAHLLRGEDEYEAEQMIDHRLARQLDHAKSK